MYNWNMQLPYFSQNGEILPIEQATIPLANISYQYGFGVYENIKIRNNIIYFISQHIDRLFDSAVYIGLEHTFKKEQVEKWIKELLIVISSEERDPVLTIKKNRDFSATPRNDNSIFSCNLKILLIGGNRTQEAQLFILPLAPLYPDRKLYSQGTTVITMHYERFLPHAKTLNMLPSYLAYTKAKKQGCYDALLLSHDNHILEGTRTNFFAMKGNSLFTPPASDVLEGVTRTTVLAVAKKHGIEIHERKIKLSELADFDGAFLTSTSSNIVPIIQIDDFQYPEIPENIKRLMKLYDEFLGESKGVFQ